MQAIITVGISASGKSTWANEYIQEQKNYGENWIVINQDDIRLILSNEKQPNIDPVIALKTWDYDPNGEAELSVKKRWDILVKEAISNNIDGIIISDTNLDGGDKKIAKLIDFGVPAQNISRHIFNISLEEAIERDKNRRFSVGEAVITKQTERLQLWLEQQNKNKLSI